MEREQSSAEEPLQEPAEGPRPGEKFDEHTPPLPEEPAEGPREDTNAPPAADGA